MPCAHQLHASVLRSSSNDKRCKLTGKRAFQKKPIGCFDDTAEGQIAVCQTAERRVQMTHEHGSGNAFSGDISAQEQEVTIGAEVVAVVAANHPCGLIVVADLPVG